MTPILLRNAQTDLAVRIWTILVPKRLQTPEKNGFGPFSYKFFVPIRVEIYIYFCEQEQLQKHATIYKNPYCAHIWHLQHLSTSCLTSFFVFVSFFCFFGEVAFSEYFCAITVLSLCGEYFVRFPLPGGVFFTL